MKLNSNFNYFLIYLEKDKIEKILCTIDESFILERLNLPLKSIKNHLSVMELCSNGGVRYKNIPFKNILSIKKQKKIKEDSLS